MDDQKQDHIDPKRQKKKSNRPKQLQTHELTAEDVKNINSTNKERDLLLGNKPLIVPE